MMQCVNTTVGSGSCTAWRCNMVGASGEEAQASHRGQRPGQCRVSVSILQHYLVALEHTLGNLWSSALQRDLRERRVERVLNRIWPEILSPKMQTFDRCDRTIVINSTIGNKPHKHLRKKIYTKEAHSICSCANKVVKTIKRNVN